MFKKNYQIIFVTFLVTGTVIACSSSSWLITWLGLEINLMSVIPLILFKLNFNSTESAIKYFIPQAMASIILITMSILDFFKFSTFNGMSNDSIILIVLALKSGMAPLHFWFPQIMMFMEWNMCVIMLVWQKIAPFVLLSIFNLKNEVIVLIILSSVVGAVGGLNQTNIKLILTYSSIIHSAWMLLSTIWSIKLWVFYFAIYSAVSLSVIMMTIKNNIFSVLILNKAGLSKMEKMTIIFNTLSLAGLPPFLGFTAKVMIIVKTISFAPAALLLTLVMTSLTSLFYYLKLFFNMLTNMSQVDKLNQNIYTKMNNMNLIFCSILINIILPALIFLT